MKNFSLVFIVAVLLVKTTLANDTYCASPDITPIHKNIVEARMRQGESLVFYVSPSIAAYYREDVQESAKVWNQHLPQGLQIELAFSEEEYNRKIHKTRSIRDKNTDRGWKSFIFGRGLFNSNTQLRSSITSIKEIKGNELISFINRIHGEYRAEACAYWSWSDEECFRRPVRANGRNPEPPLGYCQQNVPSTGSYGYHAKIRINDLQLPSPVFLTL